MEKNPQDIREVQVENNPVDDFELDDDGANELDTSPPRLYAD